MNGTQIFVGCVVGFALKGEGEEEGAGEARGRENLGARTLAAQSILFGEGKKRNEVAEWHVAWLAE